jgi:hypothetical protein
LHTLTNGIQTVAYTLGIYLLNLFLLFLQPKFDPSLTQDEGLEDGDAGAPSLPTKQDDEFRPFIRRLPEFKFWHSATRAIAIGFLCSWFSIFDIPVFWPVLVVYWIILFVLTSMLPFLLLLNLFSMLSSSGERRFADVVLPYSAKTDSAHDQVPLCAFLLRKDQIRPLIDKHWNAICFFAFHFRI